AMTGTVSSAVISRGADQSLSIADADPRAPVAPPAMAGDSGQRRTDGLLATQALVRLGASGAAQHEALIKTLTGGLQTITATQPRDAPAWQALSALWQLQGQPLRAVRADAEARAAQYDYAAAVDRLKAGQDLARKGGPGADYFEASIIDTRLREMQSLAKEQAADK
ncbi:MAG: peptidase M48, partial [Comamonas sp.]